MSIKKTVSAIALSLGLVLSAPLIALAVNSNTNNDFVNDVNDGKAALATNPAAQADVDEINNGEKDTANDKDDGELQENDGEHSPEKSEPGEANNDESDSGQNNSGSGNEATSSSDSN